MDDLYFPWWSLLLLGMWSVALTLWMSPSLHREFRLWSGLSTLFYLVLIFMAFGNSPRTTNTVASPTSRIGFLDFCATSLIAISLTAGVWLLGPISSRCRKSCYVVLTVANASLCAILKQPEVGCGLLFIAGWTARPLLQAWSRQGFRIGRERLAEFTRFTQAHDVVDDRGEFWLIGALTAAISITLLGTISYSTRAESIQLLSPSARTALPSSDQIDRVLGKQNQALRETNLVDLLLGRRADLVVLMVVMVFLCLAVSMIDLTGQSPDLATSIAVASTPSTTGERP